MKLKVKIKKYLAGSIILLAYYFFATGFVYITGEKSLHADISVSILQESDGFTVSVKTTKNINVHFYLFTVDGRLIKELNIYGSKRINITPLEKGIYIYDFFSNDERLKNGKIELR